MHLRRLISVLSVVVVASGVVAAQPKKPDKKKKAPTAEKGSAATPAAAGSATGPAAGSAAGSAAAGSAAGSAEEGPPKDIEGREENPDSPRVGEEPPPPPPPQKGTAGYPIEEARRPITLFQNMVEVSISPHAQLSPYFGSDALRARYGITPTIQIGLTYVYFGLWDRSQVDPALSKKYQIHPGKAIGPELTIQLAPWIAARVGFPIYISPFAMSLALGAPLKFRLGDKVAIGGMDDLLNVALPFGARFAPSYYSEQANARAAYEDTNNTAKSRGSLRFSGYGIYQYQPQVALIGRAAIEMDDFSANRNAAGHGGLTTSIRAGVSYALKPFLDIGGSLGWDDLATLGSFGPALYLAVRI